MLGPFLRHGSNTFLIVFLAVAGTWFAVRGHVSPLGLLAGALVFLVTEYTTHRFVFHAAPQRSPFLLGLQHRLHYDHHAEPNRLDLLFLPLWFAIPAIIFYGALYYAIVRNVDVALSILCGSLLPLAWYEWVHYVAHTPFAPRSPFGKWMKKYHLLHHYKNEHLWFGVTNPSMDLLIRTYRAPHDADKSETTRTLGI